MAGAILLVVTIIIVIPFGLFIAGACWSALLGSVLELSGRTKPTEPGAGASA